MIVLINGSFGVGKTTVAKLLRRALPGSLLYDPEWAGFVLMRLPRWVRLLGAGTDDFQDLDLWRQSVVAGTRLFGRFARGPVIVPMTFSRRDYFDEVVTGFQRLDASVKVFCLRARAATVAGRLAARGEAGEGPQADWLRRRVAECEVAHRDSHFGEPIDAEGRSAGDVAEEIIRRL